MTRRTLATPAQIAAALRALSRRMAQVGAAMDCHGGFDGCMTDRGRELIGAAHLAKEWADAIEMKASQGTAL